MALTRLLNKKDRTWIEISRLNLRHNLGVFRKLTGTRTTPIWVVKSNAYGHGILPVAKEIEKTVGRSRSRLSKGEWLGVDSIDEAIELRKQKILSPIIILGYIPFARLCELPALDVRYLVSSIETVRALAKLKRKRGVRLHLKIDTGTTRQGVLPKDALALAWEIKLSGLLLEGVATHFANVEDTDNPTYAHLQLERFIHAISELRAAGFGVPIVHAACSAAVMIYPESIFSAARIGLGLYGINPLPPAVRAHFGTRLKPVLSWHSRVALVKQIPKGTPIGYGLTERADKKLTVAIVPVGYADGYDRGLSAVGQVLIKGCRCRVLGRVCMNMIIIDASRVHNIRQEDMVTIIGRQGSKKITAQDMADKQKTIPYEVVARLSPNIPRYLV